MLITPEYVFQDVTHITPAFLAQKGCGPWCWISTTPSPATAARS